MAPGKSSGDSAGAFWLRDYVVENLTLVRCSREYVDVLVESRSGKS